MNTCTEFLTALAWAGPLALTAGAATNYLTGYAPRIFTRRKPAP